MRAFFLACPLAIMTMGGALAGGAGWEAARTEVVWTGVYAGAQLGYMQGDIETRSSIPLSAMGVRAPGLGAGVFLERDFRDASGGLYAGYMRQTQGGLVFGLEADLNATNARNQMDVAFLDSNDAPVRYHYDADGDLAFGRSFVDHDDNPLTDEVDVSEILTASVHDRVKWTGGLRGRIGYASGRFLPYVTGGFSAAKYRRTVDYADERHVLNDKLYGWSLGAGLEFAATENIIARVEYRYSDYGDAKESIALGGDVPPLKLNSSLTAHDVRVGLGLKF